MANQLFYTQESDYTVEVGHDNGISTSNSEPHRNHVITATPVVASATIKPTHGRKKNQVDVIDVPSSPRKKRSRGQTIFKIFGQPQLADGDGNSGKNGTGLFGFSQDSVISSSQFSQDFADRIGELSILSSQEFAMPTANGLNSSSNALTNDGFSIPFAPHRQNIQEPYMDDTQPDYMHWNSSIQIHSDFKDPSQRSSDQERKEIILPSPIDNPFVQTKQYSNSNNRRLSQPRTLWITAFGERSRYLSDFEIYDSLGEGTFSVVVKAKRRLDGMFYAIKKLKKSITSEKECALLLREVCALSALASCPHIVRYYSCWIDDGHLHIQTEICELGNLEYWFVSKDGMRTMNRVKSHSDSITSIGGSLKSIDDSPLTNFPTPTDDRATFASVSSSLSSSTRSTPSLNGNSNYVVNEDLIWFIVEVLAESLFYIHERDIVHLDLRPANVFIGHNDPLEAHSFKNASKPHRPRSIKRDDITLGLLNGNYTLKLGDFGHSCRIDEVGYLINEGETRYCAIELISTPDVKSIDLTKADIFSLGASIYELCLGRKLAAEGEEWRMIRNGVIIENSLNSYSADLVTLIKQLLSQIPSERWSAGSIVDYCVKHKNGQKVLDPKSTAKIQPNTTKIPGSPKMRTRSQESKINSTVLQGGNVIYLTTPGPNESAMAESPAYTITDLLEEIDQLKKDLKDARDENSKRKKK